MLWDNIGSEEETMVPNDALASPELSARQPAWKATDAGRIYISESTASCILKGEALVEKRGNSWFQVVLRQVNSTGRAQDVSMSAERVIAVISGSPIGVASRREDIWEQFRRREVKTRMLAGKKKITVGPPGSKGMPLKCSIFPIAQLSRFR